ncbi:MAG: YdiY family protein [Aureliella sp.]
MVSTTSSGQIPDWLANAGVPAVPGPGGGDALLQPPPPLDPETPPSVLTETESGPQTIWYYPWTWFPTDGWENSAELGINGSDGNAESFSFQTGARFKRKTDANLFDFRISHNRTKAGGIETQNNALFFGDYERFLADSPWTLFVKNGLEYDEFKAFDIRYNINSGVGYSFFKTDDLTLIGRFGAGVSREFGGPNNDWTPEALFGMDYEHQVNKRNKLIAKIDYFPNWADWSDFRLVSDVGWEHLIDEEGNFSVRLGANDRYDSTPNGLKPNDINYQALFLYKF